MAHIKEKITMHSLFTALLALVFVALFFSVREVRTVHNRIETQVDVERSRRLSEEQSQALSDASDYLTQEVWRFIANKHKEHLLAYWKEVNTDKSRDKALEQLGALHLTPEEEALVAAAKRESDNLVAGEAWAMRLTAESIGMAREDMPPEVAAVILNAQEAQLTPAQKSLLAMHYIFGPVYMESKGRIRGALRDFQKKLRARKTKELVQAAAATERTLSVAQTANMVILALLSCLLFCFYALVWRPFSRYLHTLREIKQGRPAPLLPAGSREMRDFALVFNKIATEWQAQNQRLLELNATDYLTGLPNRKTLEAYLHKAIEHGVGDLGVVMADIDAFKSFNDAFGHMAGDRVLVRIAHCLQTAVAQTNGLISRLSGEEFVIVLPDTDADAVNALAQVILRDMKKMNLRHELVPRTDTHITVSMGSILWDRKAARTPRELIHQADVALSQAKKNGGNRHVIFSEKDYAFILLQNSRIHDTEVESEMRGALKQGEFIPSFQPKVDLKTGDIRSAEALVRWRHPQKGLLSPDYFIPVFERNGFIKRLDFAMLEQVCKVLRTWMDAERPVIPIACNFSRVHFNDEGFAAALEDMVDRHEVPRSCLEIEITESALMDNPEAIIRQIHALRESGFTIAIDDFGVGYSSLGLLQDLPADVLKIDRSFVQRDLSDRRNIMIIRGIVQIAKVFRLQIVCEGVESAEQRAILRDAGCDLGQGYFYSRPVELQKLESLIDQAPFAHPGP